MNETYLKIENIELWARVGVLDEEREFGQLFKLDVYLWSDMEASSRNDDIELTIDYSILVKYIKDHSKSFSCYTIEKYSEVLIELIKKRFNPNKIKITLQKVNPPIIGFEGSVSIVKVFEQEKREIK